MSLVLVLVGREGGGTMRKGRGGGPLGWLIGQSYKLESRMEGERRHHSRTIPTDSRPYQFRVVANLSDRDRIDERRAGGGHRRRGVRVT